jgi:hypothetical protein
MSGCLLVDKAEVRTDHRLVAQPCLAAVLHRFAGLVDIVVYILDPQFSGVDGEDSRKDLS